MVRKAAEEALARHGYRDGAAYREKVHRREALDREILEIEGRVSWWDRVVFFHDTPDEARLREATRERDALAAELDDWSAADARALAAAGSELPPIRIADAVGRAFRAFQASLESVTDAAHEPVAESLDAVAEDVRAVFFEEVDIEAAIDDLDALLAGGDRPKAPALPADARTGWAPLSRDALVALAASQVDAAAIGAHRTALEKERAELQAAEASLATAREGQSLGQRLFGAELQVSFLEKTLEEEEWGVLVASESLRLALLGGLRVYPPMRIYLAAIAAAAILRRPRLPEPIFSRQGTLSSSNAGHVAFAAAAVVELVDATEAAFPGLLSLVGGVTILASGARDATSAPSPYRRAGASETGGATPAHAEDAQARLFWAMDRLGVASSLTRGLAHAAAAGALASSGGEARSDLSDRLAFWSSSHTKRQAEARERRASWHGDALRVLTTQTWRLVSQAGAGSFEIDLRDALVAAHTCLLTIATDTTGSMLPRTCLVYNQHETLERLDRVAAVLRAAWGLAGTRHELTEAAWHHIRTSGPVAPPIVPGSAPRVLSWSELVVSVGEALRPLGFVPLYEQLRAAREELRALLPQSALAAQSVSLLDTLNPFGKSESEQRRDELQGRARELLGFVDRKGPPLEQMIDAALQAYPPGALYISLLPVRQAVEQVRAVSEIGGSKKFQCVLYGKERANALLAAWTRAAFAAFGIAPSNGVLLARYAMRTLQVA